MCLWSLFLYRDFLPILEGKDHLVIINRDAGEQSADVAFVECDERSGQAFKEGDWLRDKFYEVFLQARIVNDQCVHCEICAKVCPSDNITVTEYKVSFADRCEVCYACVHNCPQNAIHLRKETSSARFRNEHVTLQDSPTAKMV